MRSLFDRRLPAHVEYDLLFGHRGSPGLWRPNNDGAVTLASQLRRAAQEEGWVVFGFDEGHTSILVAPQVTAQLHAGHAVLSAAAGGARVSALASVGCDARLLERRDLAWGSAFMFVDLPEGEYELMIDADRRPRHRSRHLVVPGRSGALQPIVLEPER